MSIKIGVIGAGMIGSDHALRIKDSLKGGVINGINDINKENSIKLEKILPEAMKKQLLKNFILQKNSERL